MEGSGMATSRTGLVWKATILIVGMASEWAILAVSYDPFMVAASTAPAVVSGPDVAATTVAIWCGVLLGMAAGAGNWKTRTAMVASWMLFLAVTTHRLVEFADGRVKDVWLTLPLQELKPEGRDGREETRCGRKRWLVTCRNGGDESMKIVTPLQMSPLDAGAVSST